MQGSFEIRASSGNYRVTLGDAGNMAQGGQGRSIVLVDERVADAYPIEADSVIRVPGMEETKSLENIVPVIARLRELGATRDTHLLAIGGGVIQDLATFVASIYMRGLLWSYYPTTLLGMVDSCVGGKSSINAANYKNLVGNFYPPKEVAIDLRYIDTLNPSQVVSGLLEAAKICYARGATEFDDYLAERPGVQISRQQAFNVVCRSLLAKKWFIEVDEFDQNERLLLNFGHTFGHALEAATRFNVPHGIAVGVGMLVARDYALDNGLLSARGCARAIRLSEHVAELIAAVRGDLISLRGVTPDELMDHLEGDKKHSRMHYRVVVPVGDGELKRLSLERNVASRATLAAAFARVLSKLA